MIYCGSVRCHGWSSRSSPRHDMAIGRTHDRPWWGAGCSGIATGASVRKGARGPTSAGWPFRYPSSFWNERESAGPVRVERSASIQPSRPRLRLHRYYSIKLMLAWGTCCRFLLSPSPPSTLHKSTDVGRSSFDGLQHWDLESSSRTRRSRPSQACRGSSCTRLRHPCRCSSSAGWARSCAASVLKASS